MTPTTTREHEARCHDPMGCFLAAYEEYLAGQRDYCDLPRSFSECPSKRPHHDTPTTKGRR